MTDVGAFFTLTDGHLLVTFSGWLKQILQDSRAPPADAWCRAIESWTWSDVTTQAG